MISNKNEFIKKLLECDYILRTEYDLNDFLLLVDYFFMDDSETTIFIRTNDTNVPGKYDPFKYVIENVFDIHINRTYLYKAIPYPETKLCCDNQVLTTTIPGDWVTGWQLE